MNLRKLLCGLLALCLLLTMAPAALMEADIQPAVEEVGGAIGADDLVVVSPETPASTVPSPTKVILVDRDDNPLSGTVEINLSAYKNADYVVRVVPVKGVLGDIVEWKVSNKTVVQPTKQSATVYTFRTLKAGKVKFTAKDIKSGKSASVTIKVVDDTKKASNVKIVPDPFDSRYDSDKKTVNIRDDASELYVFADVTPYKNAYSVTWTVDSMTYAYFKTATGKTNKLASISSNSPVALYFTGRPGTVKITAKVGSHKRTLKLKVSTAKNGLVMFGVDNPETIPLWSYNKKAKGDFAFEKTSIIVAANNYTVDAAANVLNTFTWKSSKKGIATVAKKTVPAGTAKITAKKAGTTTISVEKKDYAPAKLDLTVKDNGPTEVYFMDGLYDPTNPEIGVGEITLYKGQTARLIDMVAVDLPYDDDEVVPNVWANMTGKVKGAFLFTKKGHDCVDLVNKYNGTIKATKVSDDPCYIWVKTFNGKKDYIKVKVVE